MSTATKCRKVRQRSIGVVERRGPLAVLEVIDGKQADYYLAEPLRHDWGTAAYRLEKYDGTAYNVVLDEATGLHACDCPGHVQWGHRTRCKHVAGLLALQAAGKLSWSGFAD